MSTEVWLQTYPPEVKLGKGNPEAVKYRKAWQLPGYREHSPGEHVVDLFLETAKPQVGASVIDFGCGTGRASLKLAQHGLNVTMIDFVRNSLDDHVQEKLGDKFLQHDLENPIPVVAEYGFACDVLEHIPPENVDRVLNNILLSARNVFFGIPAFEDLFGDTIGEHLHLTVQPREWWLQKFKDRDCEIKWVYGLPGTNPGSTTPMENYNLFYVSAWQDGQTIVDNGVINETTEHVRENVRANCSVGWPIVMPHETNDFEVMILGGGPSLNDFEDEIKRNRAEGLKVVTLNGAYNWALDHGITPSATVCVDAREFNARFTHPVVDACKYLIASQCHPGVFEGLPKDRTFLWHTGAELIEDILKEHYEQCWPVPGGSTVLLRAIPLLRTLGYRKFILYGCDSCMVDKQGHAYEQLENDKDQTFPVILGGKTFYCTPWMAAQCTEFLSLVRFLGEEIDIEIKGDGLLAWAIEYAASLAPAEQNLSKEN